MSGASRRKGAAYEVDVCNWLKGKGWAYVERRIAGMGNDRGDINGMPGVVVECKNRKEFDLAGYCRQLEAEITEAGADTGVVIIKKAGTTDVGQHYALMPVHRWADLLVEAGRG